MFPHQGYEDRLRAFIDVLVRGGIARGQLIHDRIMVVGPAMIEAYRLESKEAFYPRIIIEKELKDQIESDIKDYVKNHSGMTTLPIRDNLFKTDEDGWCYLDYVNPAPMACYGIQRFHTSADCRCVEK